MKTIVPSTLFFFLIVSVYSQTEVARQIIEPRSFTLNSSLGSATGGNAKTVIEVDLPDYTIRWFYTFTAHRTEAQRNKAKANINLFAQLTRILDVTGTTAAATKVLITPSGSDYCDLYFFDTEEDADIFDAPLTLKSFTYESKYSQENLMQGTIMVSEKERCVGTQYLGFANGSLNSSVNVTVEVVAIVLNEWTKEDRQQMYDGIYSLLTENGLSEDFSDKSIRSFATCLLSEFCNTYSPLERDKMADFELQNTITKIGHECIGELEEKKSTQSKESETYREQINPSRKALVGTWKDDNSVFKLKEDGIFYIRWDNQKQALGNWSFVNGRLYIKMGEGQNYIPHKITSFSIDEMKYHALGDEKIYTAKRIK